jgi:sodium transport system permease protein
MTAATGRSNIVVAKYLYVATMSFIAGVLNLCAMIFSMRAILAPLGGSGLSRMTFHIPFTSIPVILLGAALLALFIAAVVMTLASFARTFKEGQSLVSPFYIVLILPIQFLQTPGQEFTTKLAFVPILNVVMMFREAMTGTYHWPLIAITLAIECACVYVALRLAMTILQHEDVITGSYSGSFGRFVKERIIRRMN